jgi:hypothetical protein
LLIRSGHASHAYKRFKKIHKKFGSLENIPFNEQFCHTPLGNIITHRVIFTSYSGKILSQLYTNICDRKIIFKIYLEIIIKRIIFVKIIVTLGWMGGNRLIVPLYRNEILKEIIKNYKNKYKI